MHLKELVVINMLKNVYRTKPTFLFAFHGELSHDDYNLVGVADNDVLEMLTDLHNSGALNNTLLIVMADHGHRFAEIRNTIQGKQEERLPFFSFAFPEWFQKKHKEAYINFKENQDKLTTPFDIHSTLLSVLNLKSTEIADITQRAVSLFTKIPSERSCADAYIEPHWCACLDWQKMPVSTSIVKSLGDTLLNTLNNYTQPHRDICEPMSILQIMWAMKLKPNENILNYKKSADMDGFIADLTGNMEVDKDMYQIQAVLVPGHAIFEASFTYSKSTQLFSLKINDVSRINMYGRQARCVENKFPHLRKYCYCRSD